MRGNGERAAWALSILGVTNPAVRHLPLSTRSTSRRESLLLEASDRKLLVREEPYHRLLVAILVAIASE